MGAIDAMKSGAKAERSRQTKPRQEGEAVPMPDVAPSVYRDRAGTRVFGSQLDGKTYSGTIAANAKRAVEDAERAAANEAAE